MVKASHRYLRVEVTEKGNIDDCEWYFTPNDAIIQFRAARRGSGRDGGANAKRMERLRISLGFEKVSKGAHTRSGTGLRFDLN